jgi:hypothetical protein
VATSFSAKRDLVTSTFLSTISHTYIAIFYNNSFKTRVILNNDIHIVSRLTQESIDPKK